MVHYLASPEIAKLAAPKSAPTPATETRLVVPEPTPAPRPKRNRDLNSDGYLQKRLLADVGQAQTLSISRLSKLAFFQG